MVSSNASNDPTCDSTVNSNRLDGSLIQLVSPDDQSSTSAAGTAVLMPSFTSNTTTFGSQDLSDILGDAIRIAEDGLVLADSDIDGIFTALQHFGVPRQ